jgi:hypothetical protein
MLKSNFLKIAQKVQYNFINKKPIYFLFCDIQDIYIKNIYRNEDVIAIANDIAEASKILDLNQIVTLQKESVFGKIIPEIQENLNESAIVYEKSQFSMVEKNSKWLDSDAVYVLLGMEAHICITQTAIDILSQGLDLVILADGVSSTKKGEREIALKNLENFGAYVTTSQSFLFLLIGDSKSPYFKRLLHIFKRQMTRDNYLINSPSSF